MPNPSLDSPGLDLTGYRALREGRDVAVPDEQPSEAPAGEQPRGDAESATGPETVTDNEDSPEGEPEPEQPEQPPKPKSPPKRGMVDEIAALRRDKRELEARLAGVRTPKPEPAPAEAAASADTSDLEPDAEKYDDYIKWQKDWNRWDRRQADKQAHADAATRARESEARERAQTWNERVQAARETRADFDTVALNTDLPVSASMASAITDSEAGAEILYFLGQNPGEAARLASLSPVATAREIGKLELKLASEAAAEAAASDSGEPLTRNTVSRAPAPVARPAGGAPRGNPVRNLEGMTQAEYRAYRETGKIR